jgi:hypothetical protein
MHWCSITGCSTLFQERSDSKHLKALQATHHCCSFSTLPKSSHDTWLANGWSQCDVPVKLLWILKVEFYFLHIMTYYSFFDFSPDVLCSGMIQKQAVGWIWPVGIRWSSLFLHYSCFFQIGNCCSTVHCNWKHGPLFSTLKESSYWFVLGLFIRP